MEGRKEQEGSSEGIGNQAAKSNYRDAQCCHTSARTAWREPGGKSQGPHIDPISDSQSEALRQPHLPTRWHLTELQQCPDSRESTHGGCSRTTVPLHLQEDLRGCPGDTPSQ